jgi:hypothetical protein
VFADTEDGHDVGMVQLGRRLGLTLEAPPLRFVGERLAWQYFEGDVPSLRLPARLPGRVKVAQATLVINSTVRVHYPFSAAVEAVG